MQICVTRYHRICCEEKVWDTHLNTLKRAFNIQGHSTKGADHFHLLLLAPDAFSLPSQSLLLKFLIPVPVPLTSQSQFPSPDSWVLASSLNQSQLPFLTSAPSTSLLFLPPHSYSSLHAPPFPVPPDSLSQSTPFPPPLQSSFCCLYIWIW